MRRLTITATFPWLLVLFVPVASGQRELWRAEGHYGYHMHGFAVDRVGDLDGDGLEEFLIGAPQAYYPAIFPPQRQEGYVEVVSAGSGAVMHRFQGRALDAFGRSARCAGDVDGDGNLDIVVGAPTGGYAQVILLPSGSLWLEFIGSSVTRFGYSVAGLGDVNQDGFGDVIVGAPGFAPYGAAFIYSGKDGSELYRVLGSTDSYGFGESVACAGDVDADGVADAIIGAPDATVAGVTTVGRALVHSGRDGATLYSYAGSKRGDYLGFSVSGAGDVDADGRSDFVIASRVFTSCAGLGYAVVVSGRTGTILHTLQNGIGFGHSARGIGDIDSDGFDDVAVGTFYYNPELGCGDGYGLVSVFSGLDGALRFSIRGDDSTDFLGFDMCSAGDLDRDGILDLLVGIPGDDPTGPNTGNARVVSGFDRSTLAEFPGKEAKHNYGRVVRNAGDFDHDSVSDLLVAYWGRDTGSLDVLSGKDGNLLASFVAPLGTAFTLSISRGIDVNQDGLPDWVLGMPEADSIASNAGKVSVISGADGSELFSAFGLKVDDGFGWAVDWVGDVDADGRPDFAGSTPDHAGGRNGIVRVFSGTNGVELLRWRGASDRLGFAFAAAGDTDADGHDDVVVGAPYADVGFSNSGSAYVYSGLDGSLRWSVHGPSTNAHLGTSVSGLGDVNADGYPDVVIGAPGANQAQGAAYVYSGRDGLMLHSISGREQSDYLGQSVSGPGDINDDGQADLIASIPTEPGAGSDKSGTVLLHSGRTGRLMTDLRGESDGSFFGSSTAGLGDIDDDQINDFVVAAVMERGGAYLSGVVYAFSSNDLFLVATPAVVRTGQTAKLLTRAGPALVPAAVFVVEVNGIPTSALVQVFTLDTAGEAIVQGVVPPGLVGFNLRFRSYAIGTRGGIIDSNYALLRIR